MNLYQEISKISLTEIFKITNNKVPTLLNNLSNVQEKVHNLGAFSKRLGLMKLKCGRKWVRNDTF